jgi:uncharacterized MAPEG superfamily protein
MTIELSLLVWSAALTLVLAVVGLQGALQQVGLETLIGNRDNMPEITGWAGRAIRAHRNLLENLVLFAILVLTAKAVGVSNGMTETGAYLFFFGRIAHAGVYIAGIVWVRTATWAVSVLGLFLIFLQLI